MTSVEGLLNTAHSTLVTHLGCAHTQLLCRLLQRQVLHALDLGSRHDLGGATEHGHAVTGGQAKGQGCTYRTRKVL